MRPVRSAGCGLFLILLVATGCGGGTEGGDKVQAGPAPSSDGAGPSSSQPLGSTTTQSSAPPTSRSATTRSPEQPTTTEGSLLRRRDSRPADVAEQAAYYAGGPPPYGFACERDARPAASPTSGALLIAEVATKMFAGEATMICVANYEVGVPVKFQVTFNAKSVWQAEVAKPVATEAAFAVFSTMPLDPVGEYTVTVTQKDRRATSTLRLDVVRNQPMFVVAESPARGVVRLTRGKPVHIGLAGWAARQRVELVLYRSTSSEPGGKVAPATFLTSFPVTVDATGQQVRVLQTRVDDPTGCYVVNTRPAVEPGPGLNVGRLTASIVEFCLV